jgi:uncharacterized membrane protein
MEPVNPWQSLHRWLWAATLWAIFLLLSRSLWLGLHGHGSPVLTDAGLPFSLTFAFLPWNFFLAWIPYGLILLLERQRLEHTFSWRTIPLWALWLLFLPNAPYLLTDFIHLRPRPPVPLWYDAGLLAAFAALGWIFGLLALYRAVQLFRRFLSGSQARLLATSVLFLSSIGVFLGRELRWNSWDALTRPQQVLESSLLLFANPFQHAEAWVMCFFLFGLLWCSYGVLESMLSRERNLEN